MATGSEVEIKGSSDAGTTFYHVLVNASGELIIADGTSVSVSGEVTIADGATVLNQNYGWNETSWQKVTIDEITRAQTTIDFQHHQIHGSVSFLSDFVDSTLADDETIILAFKTPAGTTRAHLFLEFTTLVGGDIQFWEGPTWTTNTGVLNPIINRKRLASMTSSVLLEDKTGTPNFTATDNILSNVTGLNTGSATSLHHVYAWGLKQKAVAGNARDSQEWVLKPDTTYAVVFTSEGGSNKAQVILSWYEHTDLAA